MLWPFVILNEFFKFNIAAILRCWYSEYPILRSDIGVARPIAKIPQILSVSFAYFVISTK